MILIIGLILVVIILTYLFITLRINCSQNIEDLEDKFSELDEDLKNLNTAIEKKNKEHKKFIKKNNKDWLATHEINSKLKRYFESEKANNPFCIKKINEIFSKFLTIPCERTFGCKE